MIRSPLFDSWVRCHKPNSKARLRLFCFPYAGAGASTFQSWSNLVPTDVEICAIQLPGREDRLSEPPFTHLSYLVQTLTRVLRPFLKMHFAFFGHSMGGLISFELARQLRRQRESLPIHLFISGFRAPQLPDLQPTLHGLPKPVFERELRKLQGTPEGVLQNPELMNLLLPLLRADFAVCENYVYSTGDPLNCPISVFGGLEDGKVSPEELSAWHFQTRGSFILRMFPGDHFFLQSARKQLLGALAQDLKHGTQF